MKTRTKAQLLVVLLALVAAISLVSAQQNLATSPQTATLDQIIPVDPQITVGTLPNGLRYYIRANRVPENRAELRLVVNAGSVLEDNDQQGLAHFVEHMAFNGTTHFAKQELVKFLEGIGMQFGPSINAQTGFDETTYMLQVPTDQADVLDKAFLILEDWAHNLSFDPPEIDKERGVVIEEWRLGRGADARMADAQFPVLFKGARYAERLPIGKTDILKNFKHERLKQFYADWYRPDLMAVVAVGDFSKPRVEAMIKQHFTPLQNPPNPRPRTVFEVPDHPGTLYAIATDKEATMTRVSICNKLPVRKQDTVGLYRGKIIEHLYTGMFNNRLEDLSQKPDAPFLAAGAGLGLFVKSKEMATLNAIVKDGGIEPGLEAMLIELDRVTRFGFTATELEREKKELLRFYDSAYIERDKHDSATLAAEYIRNFSQGEDIPGIAYEYELNKRFLPQITVEEVNALARTWAADHSRVVLVNAPQKPGVAIPDEAKLAAVMKNATGRKIDAYVDTGANEALVDTLPPPGSIARVSTKDQLGIVELELSNGAKVVLKQTTLKDDNVEFRAAGPGGTSLASDKDFIAAATSSQVIAAGGLGKFDTTALRKVLAGKVVRLSPFIVETEQGVSGGASPRDMETLFQMIHLTFTQPRADKNIFQLMTSQGRAMLANQTASPEFAYNQMIQATLTQNHLRSRPMTPEMVDEMSLEKSLEFYKARFADAGNFTFFFVGNFDPETIRPLIERYLASLPSLKTHETWKNPGMAYAKGVVQKTVQKGIEAKSQAAIIFSGSFQYDQAHRVAMRALGMVLQTRLRETLREDLSGTYSVNVAPNPDKKPEERYTLAIAFGCNPDRTSELIKTVFTEIAALRDSGPSERLVADVREQLLREYESNTRSNDWYMAQLVDKYTYKEDLSEILTLPDRYKKLTPAAIQEAARAYLTPDNYVQVTLLPEKKVQ
jgi:zinc protease